MRTRCWVTPTRLTLSQHGETFVTYMGARRYPMVAAYAVIGAVSILTSLLAHLQLILRDLAAASLRPL